MFHFILKIRIRITRWFFERNLKKHGVYIPKDYKTISDAIDANEKYIIVSFDES